MLCALVDWIVNILKVDMKPFLCWNLPLEASQNILWFSSTGIYNIWQLIFSCNVSVMVNSRPPPPTLDQRKYHFLEQYIEFLFLMCAVSCPTVRPLTVKVFTVYNCVSSRLVVTVSEESKGESIQTVVCHPFLETSVADPRCFSRIPDPTFFGPGSQIRIFSIQDRGSRIRIKEFEMFFPDPGSYFFPSRVPDQNFFHPGSRIPDPHQRI